MKLTLDITKKIIKQTLMRAIHDKRTQDDVHYFTALMRNEELALDIYHSITEKEKELA